MDDTAARETGAPSGAGPFRTTPRPSAPAESRRSEPEPRPAPPPRQRPVPVRPQQFVWAFPAEPPYADEAVPMRNAPAVDAEGTLFFQSGDRLVALKEDAGKPTICWEYVTGCRAPGPVVMAVDGTLRLHTSDGLLHALTTAGKQLWPPVKVGEPLGYAAPIVDAQGNTYVCHFDGGLLRIDAKGKRQKPGPYFRTRQKFDAGGVVCNNVLYVGSDGGYVFGISLTGEQGVNVWNHAAEHGHAGWYVHSAPALAADGIVVVAGQDENLYGFRLEGNLAFRTEMPGQMLGSPAIDGHGHIYVGVAVSQRGQQPRGSLVCVDGNSHKVRWECRAAGPVEATPVIGDDDLVYFGDNTGLVHAVDLRGNVQWTAQVECAVRSAGTIIAPRRLAFGLDDETLVVLECSSTALAAGGWPKLGGNLGQSGLA